MASYFADEGKVDVVDKLDIAVGSARNFKYIGWGTGAGSINEATTALAAEKTDETRATGTVSQVQTTVAGDTYQVVGTLTCSGSGATITQAVLADNTDRTDGTDRLLMLGDFTGIVVAVSDAIQFTMKLQVKQAT